MYPVNISQENVISFTSSQSAEIKLCRKKKLKENISILNHIRRIQAIGNKMVSLPRNTPAPDHIGEILKSTIRSKIYNSIFEHY